MEKIVAKRKEGNCTHCGKLDKLINSKIHGFVCKPCYKMLYKRPKKNCIVCNNFRVVFENTDNGPICPSCYEYPKRICIVCGKTKKIKKNTNEGPICVKCYEPPQKICDVCGKTNKIAKIDNNKKICHSCYSIPNKTCVICNTIKPTHKNVEFGGVCQSCYLTHYLPNDKCSICGEIKKVKQRNPYILCENCYNKMKKKYNEGFRVKLLLRCSLYGAFKRYSKNGKVKSSKEYGIDYQAIFEHIGPCPGDREDYHIDHILPLSAFDFDNPIHIKAAFAPKNHQWLKVKENLSKSANYNKEEFDNYIKKFMED